MISGELFIYFWTVDVKEDMTLIRIYGITEDNKNVCLIVNNFTPYIYIELPENIDWSETNIQMLGNKIDQEMGDDKPIKKVFVMKERLYKLKLDENGKRQKFPYLLCSFLKKKDIHTLNYILKVKGMNVYGIEKRLKLRVHEVDANEMLQIVCCRDIPTVGWIKFKGEQIHKDFQETICDYEYKVSWKKLFKYDCEKLVKPKIMGFDIEVNSSNPNSMPKPERPNDKIFQISCVMSRPGDRQEDYVVYLLSLGQPNQQIVGENVIIRCYNSEHDLLEGFSELIREENPNIISGYNILGFDIPYMIKRSELLLSVDYKKQGFHKYNDAVQKNIKWSSSAYGTQEFEFLDAEGRVFVDLLPLVRRDYKMDNYKLKTISTYFLGQTKDPLSVKGIFKCYKIGMNKNNKGLYTKEAKKAMGIVGKYCCQDSVLVNRLMEHLQTWIGLVEMAKICNVQIFTLYTQGQQIKVYSQIYRYCTYNNMVVEKDVFEVKEDERYIGAQVFNPIPGNYNIVIPFDFASLYPSVIIAYNIDYSTWVTDEEIPDSMCNVMEWEDHNYCCHDPKIIRKNNLTRYIDKEEEKIRRLREKRNKTIDKLKKKELMNDINILIQDLKPYKQEKSDIIKKKPKHIICAKRKYRFSKEPKGVVPTLLQNLLDARANTRQNGIKINKRRIDELKQVYKEKQTSEIKDEIKRLADLNTVLNKRQLAYKVSANSMYGAMGVRKGYLPFMPGAMCVTYMGRINIEKVAQTIPSKYGGQLIYGDTDSNYIHFPHLKTSHEAWDYAEYVASEVTKLFPPPIKLEFEEVIYWKFFILTKKRYMYKECFRDGNIQEKIGKKGVLLARRDNSPFVRNIYEETIDKIFNGESMNDILYFLIQKINDLCSGVIPKQHFIITKSIGSTDNLNPIKFINEKNEIKVKLGDYTVPYLPSENEDLTKRIQLLKLKKTNDPKEYYIRCLPAQVQLSEKMKKRGQLVSVGTRIEYVIIDIGNHNAKQYEQIESYEYFNKFNTILKINYLYYLKLLTNPLDQLLNIAFQNQNNFINNFILEQYNLRLKVRYLYLNEIKQIFSPNLIYK